MRVLFAGGGTGGHLYPALAIARAMVRLSPGVRPYFIGAERGIEREVLPNAGFPFVLLDLHPLYRSAPWRNVRTVAGLASALRTIGRITREQHPVVTVATGGYASGAALVHARLHRQPYVLQEQNSSTGTTIRAFASGARRIYLGFPEAAAALPAAARSRVVDSGNPIEAPPPPEARPARGELRRAWGFSEQSGAVLLAFGGSQGSAALNAIIDGWVARGLPLGLQLIWATGRDHFAQYRSRASARVAVRPYLAPIADAYAVADLALTRAGAMTTAELCAWEVPMILVPLPTAAADHQTANARALSEAGAARWLPQAEASVDHVDALVRELLRSGDALFRLRDGARRRARPRAAIEIASDILASIGHPPSPGVAR